MVRDEAGPEHPEADLVGHLVAALVGGRRRGPSPSPALRALKSSRIVAVAVAPTRVTPRAMTSISASSVRTPPAALTRVRRDAATHEREVLVGRAGRREPGGGLDEVAAGRLGQVARPDLLVVGQVGVLEDDLDDGAGGVRDVDHGPDVRLDVGVAPRT